MSKFFTLMVFAPLSLFAQNSYFSIGADGGVARGELKKYGGIGYGGSGEYQIPFSKVVAFSGTIGIISFNSLPLGYVPRDAAFENFKVISKTVAVPVQIGTRLYLSHVDMILKGWFITGQAGLMIVTRKENGDFTVQKPEHSNNFSYAPGIGFQTLHWEITYKQQFFREPANQVDARSYGNLRLAYLFRKAE